MATPEQRANQAITITVPYWVTTRIRSAMHREANSNDGCQCEEHYQYSVEAPQEAYAYVAEQLGYNQATTNSILTGQTPVTDDIARNLERVIGIPAKAWLLYESAYRRDLIRLASELTREELA